MITDDNKGAMYYKLQDEDDADSKLKEFESMYYVGATILDEHTNTIRTIASTTPRIGYGGVSIIFELEPLK